MYWMLYTKASEGQVSEGGEFNDSWVGLVNGIGDNCKKDLFKAERKVGKKLDKIVEKLDKAIKD